MRVPRSNPWPAIADLFASLLVVTFAGLISVDLRVRNGDDLRIRFEEETARASVLDSELAAARSESLQLREELSEVQEQRRSLEGQSARLSSLVERLESEVAELRGGKGGIDLPPCFLSEERVIPVLDVSIEGDRISSSIADRRLSDPDDLPVLSALLDAASTEGPIGLSRFAELSEGLLEYARSPSNEVGYSCALYVWIVISEATSQAQLSRAMAFVDDFFYIANPSVVDQWMKRLN